MPNVNVLKKELFEAIGKEFSKSTQSSTNNLCVADEDFEVLCFEYGVEVEFGTAAEMEMNRVDGDGNAVDISKEIVYKIEVAANRYDLLCLEGIAAAFRCYLGIDKKLPRFEIKNKNKKLEQIIVKPEVAEVRPFVVACVLRDIKFDTKTYNSFIDLQDKLH